LKQLNDLLGLKVKFNYNTIVIYLKLYYLLFIQLIYIDEKFPHFFPSEEERLVQTKTQLLCLRRRQDDISVL